MKIERFFKYWLPPILWMLTIISFSSFSVGKSAEIYWKDFIVKKTVHFIEYGILATLIYRLLINNGFSKSRAMFLSVTLVFISGVVDEFRQSFTPGREPRLRDVIIDSTGGFGFIYGIVNNLNIMPKFVKSVAKEIEII